MESGRWRSEAVEGADDGVCDTGVVGRVPGIVHDDELGAGPGALELPGVRERRLHVEAAVDQHAGDVSQASGVMQQHAVFEPGRCDVRSS